MEKSPQVRPQAPQSETQGQQEGLSMLGPEGEQAMQLQAAANNSPNVNQLRSLQAVANASPQVQQLKAQQSAANPLPVQRQENKTGMPDQLKSGIEGLSGMAMDDVKVHYNSSQPAQMQAHAYAQGSDIHIAPGQEKHLAHEAWHVVQQKQGRVKPTLQLKGIAINDDSELEREADVMGDKAMNGGAAQYASIKQAPFHGNALAQRAVVQRIVEVQIKSGGSSKLVQKNYVDLETQGWNTYACLVAEYLAGDSQVLYQSTVESGPGAGNYSAELKTKIDAEPIDTKNLADIVMKVVKKNNLWHDNKAVYSAVKEQFKDAFEAKKLGLDDKADFKLTDLWDEKDTMSADDLLSGFNVDITKILDKAYVAPWVDAKSIGALKDTKNDVLDSTISYHIYEIIAGKNKAAKSSGAAAGQAAAPATKPFLQLIDDINSGAITKLAFVVKYNSQSAGLGAEFTVDTPQAKAAAYANQAVVHTHYKTINDAPNYGHTKPAALKMAPGFAFSKVKLDQLLKIDDTKKAYKDLK